MVEGSYASSRLQSPKSSNSSSLCRTWAFTVIESLQNPEIFVNFDTLLPTFPDFGIQFGTDFMSKKGSGTTKGDLQDTFVFKGISESLQIRVFRIGFES